jgi:hypothetical protein
MSEIPPSEWVSSEAIQSLFNDADYVGQVRRAILYELIRRCKQKRPCRGSPEDPPETRSQTVEFFNRHGDRIAVVHRYVRPDGRIGASGKQDPKWLLHEGTLYIKERDPQPRSADCGRV